jgi:hypothetical protein
MHDGGMRDALGIAAHGYLLPARGTGTAGVRRANPLVTERGASRTP